MRYKLYCVLLLVASACMIVLGFIPWLATITMAGILEIGKYLAAKMGYGVKPISAIHKQRVRQLEAWLKDYFGVALSGCWRAERATNAGDRVHDVLAKIPVKAATHLALVAEQAAEANCYPPRLEKSDPRFKDMVRSIGDICQWVRRNGFPEGVEFPPPLTIEVNRVMNAKLCPPQLGVMELDKK